MKNILFFLLIIQLISCGKDETLINSNQNSDDFNPYINYSGSYTLYHGGKNRLFHYYHPQNLPENSPLVFVLHGYNGNASNFMDWFPMKKLADENGFAVVFPQGSKDNKGTPHWNSNLTISNVDDVGFLSKVAKYLHNTYNLDPDKTFTCGYSNGGFMSYELILKKPDIFKAAASINGTMSYGSWNNRLIASPSPILQISGKLDRIVPVDGLVSLYGGWGGAPGIEEIMKFWSEINNSDSLWTVESNTLKIKKYIDSKGKNDVWFYLEKNLDHRIPMGGNYHVHSPSLIWEFFSNF